MILGNYYTDACLLAAGGKSAGKLDFYQMHTYTSNGVWNPDSPFKVKILWTVEARVHFWCHSQVQGSSYGLAKPLIIGEFATTCSMNEGVTNLFQHAYQSYQVNIAGTCLYDHECHEMSRFGWFSGSLDLAIQRRRWLPWHASNAKRWYEQSSRIPRTRRNS